MHTFALLVAGLLLAVLTFFFGLLQRRSVGAVGVPLRLGRRPSDPDSGFDPCAAVRWWEGDYPSLDAYVQDSFRMADKCARAARAARECGDTVGAARADARSRFHRDLADAELMAAPMVLL